MSTPFFTILGSTGFIGSHLVKRLEATGHKYMAPRRSENWLEFSNLGHIIYCIGLTSDFREHPLETVEAHVCLLRRLLEKNNFTSLTYLSSTRVYTGSLDTRETASLSVNPGIAGDLYNISKLMGESLCLHGGASRTRIARLSNIVGLRQDPDIFIDQLLEEGLKNGHIQLHTSLDSSKDYLHIDDAVEILIKIASSTANGIFNVASGQSVPNAEIMSYLKAHMGIPFNVDKDAKNFSFQNIDTSRIRQEFGFNPKPFNIFFPEFLEQYRHKKGLS